MLKNFSFEYTTYNNPDELSSPWKELLYKAREAIDMAWAPYSQFKVGAALLMEDDSVVCGSNQENAAFPAGICAERVALSTASSTNSKQTVVALAIAYRNERGEGNPDQILSPCGICRQSIIETISRQGSDLMILLSSPSGKVVVIPDAKDLMPFAFSSDHL